MVVSTSKRIKVNQIKARPFCIKKFYDAPESDVNGVDGGRGLLVFLLLLDLAVGGDCEDAGEIFEDGVGLFELL